MYIAFQNPQGNFDPADILARPFDARPVPRARIIHISCGPDPFQPAEYVRPNSGAVYLSDTNDG